MSLDEKIKNLVFSEENIGANVKVTKTQFKWQFDYKYTTYCIELFFSKLSGKKKLIIDGKLEKQIEDHFVAFSHSFVLGGDLNCMVIQFGEKYELRIENQSFTHLYEVIKNKKAFNNEAPLTNYIKVNIDGEKPKHLLGTNLGSNFKPKPKEK